MSFSEDNIRIFQQLIITQPQLFSEHEAELHYLAANLPIGVEKISDAISDWCAAENRPQILEALLKLHDDLDGSRIPGTKELKAPPSPPPDKIYRETLLNAIQESFPNKSKQPQALGDDKS